MSWSGCKFHCIKCGTLLEEEIPPEETLSEWDFDSDQEYQNYLDSDEYDYHNWHYNNFGASNTYHCSNEQCQCKETNSVVLFHPLGDIGSAAGDSLAFGIQTEPDDNIYCFSCGNIVNKNKMCCSNKKCYYSFDHALDVIEKPNIVFGLGFIK